MTDWEKSKRNSERPELANSVEKLTVGMIFSSQQFLETMFLSGYCPFFY